MGDVTDKFRRVCNAIDGLPNYPADWLPELYAIVSELNGSIKTGDKGMCCSKNDMQRFLAKFGNFRKKYLGLKKA